MTASANDNPCPGTTTALTRFFRSVALRMRERRALRELLSLDDHLLRDIGVTRYDVMMASNPSASGTCGSRLARAVEENRRSSTYELVASLRLPLPGGENVKLAA
jgi:uncharacterized protein YjiS (DUF1127 family)